MLVVCALLWMWMWMDRGEVARECQRGGMGDGDMWVDCTCTCTCTVLAVPVSVCVQRVVVDGWVWPYLLLLLHCLYGEEERVVPYPSLGVTMPHRFNCSCTT